MSGCARRTLAENKHSSLDMSPLWLSILLLCLLLLDILYPDRARIQFLLACAALMAGAAVGVLAFIVYHSVQGAAWLVFGRKTGNHL